MKWNPMKGHNYGWTGKSVSENHYGWLEKMGKTGGGPAAPTGFTEDTTGASAAYKFDEASGAIVDEIVGLSLGDNGNERPTYSVSFTGDYSGVSPGITYPNDAWHNATTGTMTGFNFGTGDITIEYDFKNSTVYQSNVFATKGTTGGTNLEVRHYSSGGSKIGVYMEFVSGFTFDAVFSSSVDLFDGNPHHVRIWLDRSANAECWVDGTNMGTVDISSANGQAMRDTTEVVIGNRLDKYIYYSFHGTLGFIRFTKSLVNTHGSGG